MRCGAQGSGSMASEAEAAQGGSVRPAAAVPALFSMGRKNKAGWARWAKRLSMPMGRLGRLGQNLKKSLSEIKNLIFEFTRDLEICTRRFRRNFETRIFPKFF
jgi:hypothetical protein